MSLTSGYEVARNRRAHEDAAMRAHRIARTVATGIRTGLGELIPHLEEGIYGWMIGTWTTEDLVKDFGPSAAYLAIDEVNEEEDR